MAVTLINPFRVAPENEADFLDLWEQTHAVFREKAGFVGARLVKAIDDQPQGQTAPYSHLNVAQWENRDAYAAALTDPRLKPLGGRYLKIATLAPALYEPVAGSGTVDIPMPD